MTRLDVEKMSSSRQISSSPHPSYFDVPVVLVGRVNSSFLYVHSLHILSTSIDLMVFLYKSGRTSFLDESKQKLIMTLEYI